MRHGINIILMTMLVLVSTVYTVDAGNIGKEVTDTANTLQGTSITVVSPNGGENWARGTTHTIKWNLIGSTGSRVKIELYRGSALSRTISSSTSNDGSYSWTVPSSQALDSNYKIRITSRSDPLYTDTSDNSFTISGPSITVVFPNGGENWARGTTHTIKWNLTGSTGSRVKIELYRGSALSRTISSSTSNDGSYSWTVPSSQALDSNYKIRITSRSDPLYTDTSDNSFNISGPSITVVSPNGGENWARGTTHTIKWNLIGSTGSLVKIELYRGSALSRTISSSTSNDGSYSWTVPSSQTSDDNYKIKITSRSDPLYTDTSDNSFTISGLSITVVSPNGRENWARGTTHTETFNLTFLLNLSNPSNKS